MSDQVVFVREQGKYEKLSKEEFYKKFHIQELCVSQDDLEDTDVLNKIHNEIKVYDLSSESLESFIDELGVGCFISTAISDIKNDGHVENFNYGYNSICYSSVRFLNFGGVTFASEVFDNQCFSAVDFEVFDFICKHKISGVKEIYIKNWR
jgi:hypothetical protein